MPKKERTDNSNSEKCGNVESKTRAIVTPFLEENDCKLWDVVFEKEGAMFYLRILFDGDDPGNPSLSLEKCEELTPLINQLLDKQDFIKLVDILEIGSPGITRRLRHKAHFEIYGGKKIRIMKRADNGKTEIIIGTLKSYDDNEKTINIINNQKGNQNEEQISLKKCIRVTLEEYS